MSRAADQITPGQDPNAGHSRKKRSPLALFFGVLFGGGSLPRSTVLSSVIIGLLGLVLPLVMLQIYDRILVNQSTATLTYLMIGLGTAILLEGVLKVMRAYLIGWSATKFSYDKNLDALFRIVKAPTTAFERDSPSSWMDRLESLERYNAFESGQSRLVLLDLPFIAIYLAFIYLIAQPLAYALIAMIVLFVAVISFRARKLRSVMAEQSDLSQRRDDYIAETLEGIEAVKSLAMEPQMMRRFERLQISNSAISHRSIALSNELQIYSQIMGNVVLIIMVTFGAYLAIHGAMSVGTLAACTLLTSRVMQPVMRGIQVLMELEGAMQALQNAGAIFDLPTYPKASSTKMQANRGARIEIKDMAFCREQHDKPLLSNVNLTVEPGEIVSIKGDLNSGRSTLLRLILGELEPSAGQCLINGEEAFRLHNYHGNNNVVRVSQDSAIFRGTIMENITMFREGPDIVNDARRASRLVGLEEDVHRLPQGYGSMLGTGISEQLSRGMVQRIVITRALALSPQVLLFDEANAMLDLRSDERLRLGLARLRGTMTIVIVSSRPSLLAVADRNFVLQNGALAHDRPEPSPAQTRSA